MAKPQGGEQRVRRLQDIISGSSASQKKGGQKAVKSLPSRESDRIDQLTRLMMKPSKTVIESGNLTDLRRELAQVKSKVTALSGRILEADTRLQTVEDNRKRVQKEIEELAREENTLREALVFQRQAESALREQTDNFARQRQEEQISLAEIENSQKNLAEEGVKLQKELKASKYRLEKTKTGIKAVPDRHLKADAQISENLLKITESEKRLKILDKELASAKTALEAAISQQRTVAQEYDRICAEKAVVEDAYRIYDNVDRIASEKGRCEKTIADLRNEISAKQKEIEGLQNQKKALKASADKEDDKQRQIRNAQEVLASKTRSLASKFTVYAELDDAARQMTDVEKKMVQGVDEMKELAGRLKETQEKLQGSRKEIQALIQKEDQLKRKLDEVLQEKQRLEQELQEISGNLQQEKLIIELPEVLREAIRKETEKITASAAGIQALEKTEKQIKEHMLKLKESEETDRKIYKSKEKQLVYIQNKIGSAGYNDEERMAIKRQMDASELEKKELEAQMNASNAERRQAKSKLLKTESQIQISQEGIEAIEKRIDEAKAAIVKAEEDLKATRERKIKSWAGGVPVMRVFYPVKAQIDRMLDEKSKLKANFDEALRMQRKAESDMDSAEKYVEKVRGSLSGLEEEYVEVSSRIHSVEKQNAELKSQKESIARQTKDDEEHIPLIEAEIASQILRLAEIKKHTQENAGNKRQHEKSMRGLEASMGRLSKKLDAALAVSSQTTEKMNAAARKKNTLSSGLGQENTKVLQVLDEKNALEKELEELKRQQTVIESEIKIIMGIYER